MNPEANASYGCIDQHNGYTGRKLKTTTWKTTTSMHQVSAFCLNIAMKL